MPIDSDALFASLKLGIGAYGEARDKRARSMSELDYVKTVLHRIIFKTIIDGDCWRYTGKHVGDGYGSITYKDKSVRLNRFIAYAFHEMPLLSELYANHQPICRFRDCWRPEHIYVGTAKDNVRDSIYAGTFHNGTENIRHTNQYNTFGKGK